MNKLYYYFKIGVRASIVKSIAGLVVLLPFLFFIMGGLDWNLIKSEQIWMGISPLYWIIFAILATLIDGFALYKYKGWIFK